MECRSEHHKYTGMFRGVLRGCDFRILLFRYCIYVLFKIDDIYVYVIAREGVRFGINFTSCCENDNEIARGAAKCYFAVIATTSGIYPKISLLPVLSKFNSILILMKSRYVIFNLASTMSSGFLLLPASRDGSCGSPFVCAYCGG